MNLYEEGLSHVIGFRVRKKTLKRVVGLILLFAAVVTPITFRHAIWDYSQRRAAMVEKWVVRPEVNALEKNMVKQMRDAKLRQQQVLQQPRQK